MSDKFQEKGLFENIQWFDPDPKHHRCRGPRNREFMHNKLTEAEKAELRIYKIYKFQKRSEDIELNLIKIPRMKEPVLKSDKHDLCDSCGKKAVVTGKNEANQREYSLCLFCGKIYYLFDGAEEVWQKERLELEAKRAKTSQECSEIRAKTNMEVVK